jgi:KipI family sensor histidine kinase inhibitor
MTHGARFQAASDRSLLVRFGDDISIETNEQVRRLLRLLEAEPIAHVRNLNPAYCSLLITFDALKLTHGEVEEILRGYLDRLGEVRLPESRLVEIPVCYGGELGPDLEDVAELHGIAPSDVIELHRAAGYIVYFLGFVPGFAYLGGLPEELATPRLVRPRRSVPAGSVGIAGKQTGVYPFDVPGGWRLIGRTPVKMFREVRDIHSGHSGHNGHNGREMSLLAMGDRVRFTAISRERFAALESA